MGEPPRLSKVLGMTEGYHSGIVQQSCWQAAAEHQTSAPSPSLYPENGPSRTIKAPPAPSHHDLRSTRDPARQEPQRTAPEPCACETRAPPDPGVHACWEHRAAERRNPFAFHQCLSLHRSRKGLGCRARRVNKIGTATPPSLKEKPAINNGEPLQVPPYCLGPGKGKDSHGS